MSERSQAALSPSERAKLVVSTWASSQSDTSTTHYLTRPFCRSFLVTALDHLFREESIDFLSSTPPLPAGSREGKREIYHAFLAELSHALERIDEKTALDGIPLDKLNWFQLETALPNDGPTNREDRGTSLKDDSENSAKLIKLRADILMRECILFLSIPPGREGIPSNKVFLTVTREIVDGIELSTAPWYQDHVYRRVIFRNDSATIATQLLHLVNIPLPKGQDCFEFDSWLFEQRVKHPSEVFSKFDTAWYHLRHDKLLPLPIRDRRRSQDHFWDKPVKYIAAALALDETIKGREGVQLAIEHMKNCYRTIFHELKTRLDEDEELKLKKEAWFYSLREEVKEADVDVTTKTEE